MAGSTLQEITEDISGSSLYNHDLAPTRIKDRTWGKWNIAALWVGMSVCIPTYQIASSMIAQGMQWWQAVFTVMLGNVIVLIPMVLNAHAGTKFGIPFPVFLRAAFGTVGANIPAIIRGVVACGWFGIQAWIGGKAIYQIYCIATNTPMNVQAGSPAMAEFLCFGIFWLINMAIVWRGIESIKWLETLAAPFLLVIGVLLLFWAISKVGGLGPMLDPSVVEKTVAASGAPQVSFWVIFFPNLTAMVGYWATLSLNIPDFTRFAKSQKDQLVGQAIGLPTTMTFFAFIGVAVTCATVILNDGKAIWDPIELIGRRDLFGSGIIQIVALLGVTLATLSMNTAANIVSPANDFSNVAPKLISFKRGGTIAGVVAIAMMPWKLIADPSGYIFVWLIGISALLGSVGGVMIADYFLLRKTELNAADLYKTNGVYAYGGGFNPKAIIALVCGILPNLPGFLGSIHLVDPGSFFTGLYTYAWFVAFFVSLSVYYLLMRRSSQI